MDRKKKQKTKDKRSTSIFLSLPMPSPITLLAVSVDLVQSSLPESCSAPEMKLARLLASSNPALTHKNGHIFEKEKTWQANQQPSWQKFLAK